MSPHVYAKNTNHRLYPYVAIRLMPPWNRVPLQRQRRSLNPQVYHPLLMIMDSQTRPMRPRH